MAMEVHIGARMEAVAPRKVTDTGDRIRLLLLLLVAILVHVWIVWNTAVTARDSIGFARYALQLEDPQAAKGPTESAETRLSIADVLKRGEHPPGYPITVLAASFVVRATYHAPLADQLLLSTQVASAFAAILLVFPTYWIGRSLYGKTEGFIGALLFQVLPIPAEITSDGLTEGVFLLTLGTSLLLGIRAVKKPGVGGFLLCGLSSGVTYLVRPEGLMAVFATAIVVIGMALARRWQRSSAAAWLTALAVGTILPAVPYMVLIGGITNKPTGIEMLKIGNIRERLAQTPKLSPDAPLFAAWYTQDTASSKTVWAFKELFKESFQAFHYVPAVIAVIGLFSSLRRVRNEPWFWIPILFTLLTMIILVALGMKKDYLSERHTLPIVYVGCIMAGRGLLDLPGVLRRISLVGPWPGHPSVAWVLLLAIVISSIPKMRKPLHENRVGHIHAGRYLNEPLDPANPDGPKRLRDIDTLVDPFEWVQFYAGRTIKAIPPDPEPLVGRYRYAVLEKGESPHSHLHRYQAALNIASDMDNRAEIVFWWPKEVAVEQARVVIFRQKILLKDEQQWREAHQAAIEASKKK